MSPGKERLSSDSLRQKDLLPSVRLNFEVAEGISIPQGLAEFENLANQTMPAEISGNFAGLAKVSTETKSNTLILMGAAILVMYFVLEFYMKVLSPLDYSILHSPRCVWGSNHLAILGEPLSLFTIVGFLLLIGNCQKKWDYDGRFCPCKSQRRSFC